MTSVGVYILSGMAFFIVVLFFVLNVSIKRPVMRELKPGKYPVLDTQTKSISSFITIVDEEDTPETEELNDTNKTRYVVSGLKEGILANNGKIYFSEIPPKYFETYFEASIYLCREDTRSIFTEGDYANRESFQEYLDKYITRHTKKEIESNEN